MPLCTTSRFLLQCPARPWIPRRNPVQLWNLTPAHRRAAWFGRRTRMSPVREWGSSSFWPGSDYQTSVDMGVPEIGIPPNHPLLDGISNINHPCGKSPDQIGLSENGLPSGNQTWHAGKWTIYVYRWFSYWTPPFIGEFNLPLLITRSNLNGKIDGKPWWTMGFRSQCSDKPICWESKISKETCF